MIYQMEEEEEEEEVQRGEKRMMNGRRESVCEVLLGSLLILMSMKKAFFWARIRLLQFSGGWCRLLAR